LSMFKGLNVQRSPVVSEGNFAEKNASASVLDIPSQHFGLYPNMSLTAK